MIDALKRIGAMAPQSRRRWASCSSGWSTAGYRSHEAVAVFFGIRLGLRAAASSRCCATPIVDAAEPAAGARRLRRSATCCRAWCSAAWRSSGSTGSGSALPDALDLLVVSVEAGLGLDQAIQRVGDELDVRASRAVRRAAADQPRAARRQGARRRAAQPRASAPASTTSSSLVAMLVQTDKFGTSVAQSLRVHSDTRAHQAAPARRGSRGEDRRQDGVPAGVLHLPGDLGRDDRPGRHQVHRGHRPDGATNEPRSHCDRRSPTLPNVAPPPPVPTLARRTPAWRSTRSSSCWSRRSTAARRPAWRSPTGCGCRSRCSSR